MEDALVLLPRLQRALAAAGDASDDGSLGYCNVNSAVWGDAEDPSRLWLGRSWARWLGAWLGAPPSAWPAAAYGDVADGGAATSAPLPAIATLSRCCAQFVVSRERVTARPRAFYREALARLIDAHDAPDDGRADDTASAGPPGAAAAAARAATMRTARPRGARSAARAASRRWGCSSSGCGITFSARRPSRPSSRTSRRGSARSARSISTETAAEPDCPRPRTADRAGRGGHRGLRGRGRDGAGVRGGFPRGAPCRSGDLGSGARAPVAPGCMAPPRPMASRGEERSTAKVSALVAPFVAFPVDGHVPGRAVAWPASNGKMASDKTGGRALAIGKAPLKAESLPGFRTPVWPAG